MTNIIAESETAHGFPVIRDSSIQFNDHCADAYDRTAFNQFVPVRIRSARDFRRHLVRAARALHARDLDDGTARADGVSRRTVNVADRKLAYEIRFSENGRMKLEILTSFPREKEQDRASTPVHHIKSMDELRETAHKMRGAVGALVTPPALLERWLGRPLANFNERFVAFKIGRDRLNQRRS